MEEENSLYLGIAPWQMSLAFTKCSRTSSSWRLYDHPRIEKCGVPGRWPCGISGSNGIPHDSFLGESVSLMYSTIDSFIDAVICPGPCCLLYKRNFKKAHDQFPVDPRDYYLLGYNWDNQFYFDTVLTTGLNYAAMACQQSTSAVSWISWQQGRSLFTYLDDLIKVVFYLLTSLRLQQCSKKSCLPLPVTICWVFNWPRTMLRCQWVPSVSVRLRNCWKSGSLSPLPQNQLHSLLLAN